MALRKLTGVTSGREPRRSPPGAGLPARGLGVGDTLCGENVWVLGGGGRCTAGGRQVACEGWSHREDPLPPAPAEGTNRWRSSGKGRACPGSAPACPSRHPRAPSRGSSAPAGAARGRSQPVPGPGRPALGRLLQAAPHSHPHEDEQAGVSDAVLALGDLDHGELVRAGAVAQDLPHLRPERRGWGSGGKPLLPEPDVSHSRLRRKEVLPGKWSLDSVAPDVV